MADISATQYGIGSPVTPISNDQSGVPRSVSSAFPLAVGSGVTSRPHNRNINAASSTWASATNTVTWPSGISEITITQEVTTTQGALQNSQSALIVFDAPNDAVASSWLADTGSSTTDVEYAEVFDGVYRTFNFSSPITRIDVLPIGTGDTVSRFIVEAN